MHITRLFLGKVSEMTVFLFFIKLAFKWCATHDIFLYEKINGMTLEVMRRKLDQTSKCISLCYYLMCFCIFQKERSFTSYLKWFIFVGTPSTPTEWYWICIVSSTKFVITSTLDVKLHVFFNWLLIVGSNVTRFEDFNICN